MHRVGSNLEGEEQAGEGGARGRVWSRQQTDRKQRPAAACSLLLTPKLGRSFGSCPKLLLTYTALKFSCQDCHVFKMK